MPTRTPLADLIEGRMHELGLDAEALGFRLGCYRNPLKAAGRVHALIEGHITTEKSRRALARLPEGLGVAPEVVDVAVEDTRDLLAHMERHAEGNRRRILEEEERAWEASFKPHAVIQTETTVPSQIIICGLTGGAERWLIIRFDPKPPITFIQQAIDALPSMVSPAGGVPFFGRAVGLVINYATNKALRCNLDGNPLEVLPKAFRVGEVQLSLGGKGIEPRVLGKLLGTYDGGKAVIP